MCEPAAPPACICKHWARLRGWVVCAPCMRACVHMRMHAWDNEQAHWARLRGWVGARLDLELHAHLMTETNIPRVRASRTPCMH